MFKKKSLGIRMVLSDTNIAEQDALGYVAVL
jgi:hypothetical protein